jgi:hypothetical protein
MSCVALQPIVNYIYISHVISVIRMLPAMEPVGVKRRVRLMPALVSPALSRRHFLVGTSALGGGSTYPGKNINTSHIITSQIKQNPAILQARRESRRP